MEELYFDTTDNLKLSAIHEKNGSDICVVLCHGIRGNKTESGNFIKLISKLNNMKIDSFRFDFRGHGNSQGKFVDMTISKEIEDLESVMNYLSVYKYKKIIVLGASFGCNAVTMLDYSKYHNVIGLILWYPAINLKYTDLFTEEQYLQAKQNGYVKIWNMSHTKAYEFGLSLFEECYKFKAYEVIEKVTLPKVFIHGDKDINVDIKANSIEPSKRSPNSKLVVIKDGVHSFSRVDERYVDEGINETINFIKSLINSKEDSYVKD